MPSLFTDLPPKVVELIFGFIDHKKDRRSLALVSKACYKIIRQQSTSRQAFIPWRIGKAYSSVNVLEIFVSVDRFPFHAAYLTTEEIERNREFWKRHGAVITEFTFVSDQGPSIRTKGWKQSTLIEMMELFPNLQKIEFDACKNPLEGIENIAQKFGIGVKEVTVTIRPKYQQWNAFLSLFPGLKRAHLHFTDMGSPPNLAEFRKFLDFWSTRLDELELNINHWDTPKLFKAFEEWNNEKLTFGHVQLILDSENMESIKWFFSYPRHIKELEAFGRINVLDKPLFDILNRNATIERLEAPYMTIRSNSIPKVFYNVNGVKKIDLHLKRSPINSGNFTPEALLKVTEFTDIGIAEHDRWDCEDIAELRHFQNLRKLVLYNNVIFDKDVEVMAENFPNLEEIIIRSDFHGFGGTLFSPLRKLKKIELDTAGRLTDESLIVGFDLPNLKSLKIDRIRNGNITLTGIKGLIANCPNLEIFRICGIDDDCRVYIKENLRYLE